ncbi:hypothetical protein BU26DRAFT_611154 [Trematosphaeria pertusa]|uniref:Uncharacterized protein n=1 Tax=Trematosphaeria pertusa TaxID=390896 RepID=A0A6A6HU42_9PLEO|nr:uncharacterized protein BU26DRAFT_611154 [Trematosphaeria pertusa]KAF2240940.1 hypothetical protein BU26DRAFT_611154 [Trematosphaeria pertusa]
MQPALALATQWLTHASLRGWWIHALYGRYSIDSSTGRRTLAPDESREADLDTAARDLEDAFARLAGVVRFYWAPVESGDAVTSVNKWWALGRMAGSNDDDDEGGGGDGEAWIAAAERAPVAPVIGVPTLFLYHLLSPRGACLAGGACSELRLQFHIAKILVHEVAHAFFLMLHGDVPEPYFSPGDYMPEAGYSWQEYVFGGDVSCFPLKRSCVGALLAAECVEMHAFPGIGVPVDMGWVERWFLAATWESVRSSDIEELRPLFAGMLGRKYAGLIYADRYIGENRQWARVLYRGGEPVAVRGLVLPGAPLPLREGGMKVRKWLKRIPPGDTVAQWWKRVSDADVGRAVADGFAAENFVRGRSRLYRGLCYDGEGEMGAVKVIRRVHVGGITGGAEG